MNPAAFRSPSGTVGDLGRNAVRGFGAWQSDVAAERPVRVNDSVRLVFRAEAYNIANHPNFNIPNRTALSFSASSKMTRGSLSVAARLQS